MVPSNAKDLVRPSPNSEEFIFLAHCGCEIHSLNVCLQDATPFVRPSFKLSCDGSHYTIPFDSGQPSPFDRLPNDAAIVCTDPTYPPPTRETKRGGWHPLSHESHTGICTTPIWRDSAPQILFRTPTTADRSRKK